MNAGPQDPMTEVAMAMVAMHEMYVSACRAGFTQDEALTLIARMMTQQQQQQPQSGDDR